MRNIFDALFFGSIGDTMRLGLRRYLVESDMPPSPESIDPRAIALVEHPLDLSSPLRFGLRLIGNNHTQFLRAFCLMLLLPLFDLLTPLLVFNLVKTVRQATTSDVTLSTALLSAVAMAAVPAARALSVQHYFYAVLRLYQKFINILNVHIYHHALRIGQTDRNRIPVGDLVNHMASDADAVADLNMIVCEFCNSFLVLLGGSILLFHFAGWPAFVGLCVIFCVAPLTRLVAPRMVAFGDELMVHSDARGSAIAQILRGIRIVKYFCWTKGVEAEVRGIRERELGARMRFVVVESLANLGFSSVTVLVALGVFGTRILAGHGLDAATAFSCIATLVIMQDPIGRVSHQLGSLLQIRVAARRLIGYFNIPESARAFCEESDLAPEAASKDGDSSATLRAPALTISNLVVRYENQKELAVNDISISIRAGESVAIVGPVASGKSSLLLALLGEVPVASGEVVVSGLPAGASPRIAWVPQEAFIINASVKENILLGAPESGLDAAVSDAMLGEDVSRFPAGLLTEIGDHGVNLSGGQKQRVSLARAAAHGPNLIFLDDPLSAVDHQTEYGLIERLLFGRWAGTTRIVATHRLTHLARFDRVVFLVDGRLVAEGTYRELMERSESFRHFVAERAAIEDQDEQKERRQIDVVETTVTKAVAATGSESRLTDDEERATGAVKVGVYWKYLRYFGGEKSSNRRFILTLFATGLLMTTALPMLQETWLAVWLNRAEHGRASFAGIPLPHLASDSGLGITIYALLGIAVIATHLAHMLFSRWRSICAGRQMHELALSAVLRAPIRFFDATPIGRILNRFSRDMVTVDQRLADSLPDFVWCLTKVAVTMTFILVILPTTLVAVVPVFYLYYRFQKIYRASAREAKRLHSITTSLRFSHFKETLEGLAVARAYGRQSFFIENFLVKLERVQRVFHATVLMNRWFSARVPLLSGAITLAVTVGIVLLARGGHILPATAGLAIGFLLNLTGSLNWAVRAFSDLESQMTGVERLAHFVEIEPEPDLVREPVAVAANEVWPSEGTIVFEDVEARYAPHLPLVLKGFSATVPGGKRVALVGRTGSGKTTVFQALFRFLELSRGTIRIDGKDIAAIPLERLRGAIAVIPQDPVLFIGSLRRNLDYFGRHADEAIWGALRRVRLDAHVELLPGKLDTPILENGANLSQGQRQLVCLARAFLDRSKIIVMDEATASVDVQTDALIQRTIREECAGITVLVIAHRLGTVSDCDFTIQLTDGRASV